MAGRGLSDHDGASAIPWRTANARHFGLSTATYRLHSRIVRWTLSSGDRLVYVPDEKDSGVYAYGKVVSRRFYYSQAGELTMIRLACELM